MARRKNPMNNIELFKELKYGLMIHFGLYSLLGDYEIPDEIPTTFSSDNNSIWGFKKSPYGLYESICSLNCSWGYSAVADEWMSPEALAKYRLKLEKLGVNFMVNIGPDWLGRIPYQAQEILLTAAEKYKGIKK